MQNLPANRTPTKYVSWSQKRYPKKEKNRKAIQGMTISPTTVRWVGGSWGGTSHIQWEQIDGQRTRSTGNKSTRSDGLTASKDTRYNGYQRYQIQWIPVDLRDYIHQTILILIRTTFNLKLTLRLHLYQWCWLKGNGSMLRRKKR